MNDLWIVNAAQEAPDAARRVSGPAEALRAFIEEADRNGSDRWLVRADDAQQAALVARLARDRPALVEHHEAPGEGFSYFELPQPEE